MAVGVIIWEWQNEFGSWRPYSPQITSYLESNTQSTGLVPLGSVDPRLYLYHVDVQNLYQTRQGTGTQRPVRRTVLPSTSPLAKGITWQWEGDTSGSWCDFDIDIINYLDECFNKGQTVVDLSLSKFLLPYHIDLSAMTQKRIETGRVRNIQRTFTSVSYPKDSSAPLRTGTKRQSSTVNKNSTKKSRNAVSAAASMTPAAASGGLQAPTSGAVPPGFNTSGITSTTHLPTNVFAPIPIAMNTCASQAPQIPTAVQFNHAHQGPITRRRYIQNLNSLGQQNQSANTIQPANQSASHPMASAFSQIPAHNAPVTQAGSPFLAFTSIAGFQPNVFHNQGSNNLGPVPVFGGNPIPGSMFGFQSVGSSSSTGAAPPGQYHHGSLNPALLFAGSRTGKIRPSASQGASSSQQTGLVGTSSTQLPRYERIPNSAHKSSKKGKRTSPRAEDILNNYVVVLTELSADEDCCICCEKLIEASGHGTGSPDDQVVYKLEKCSHSFHKLCLTAMYDSGPKDGHLQCPTCKTIYGEKMGNCPKGDMEYKIIDHELAGYEGHRTIQIVYSISSGIQGREHPHAGKRYSARGFPRIGYLPDCDKGRLVLQLLIIAWKRRLTFTIGHSTTTGEENTVTWNEIHHKTELGTNYSGHGFPDPKYLDNALLELGVHGITEKDLPSG